MKIEDYLVTSTVNGVMAQRLVRRYARLAAASARSWPKRSNGSAWHHC